MPGYRPNPELLLSCVEQQESHKIQGKLKIFLGAAPGVGKTYSMLQEAIQRYKQGIDIVAGIVESHGRLETETLLQELEIIPRVLITYRGKQLTELDLDKVIQRNPALVLIDEMAHTNIPGSRHVKRWQDIKELLDCGIDVYTTLNIQHIESLNDVVAPIIGARIQETVPDSAVEFADTVELVDLSPEDLLQRLQAGKVYLPTQAELATKHYFQISKLTALREVALRYMAERVNVQVLLQRTSTATQAIWPTVERLMVCIDAKPDSAKLIRAARRLATSLRAEWFAIYVVPVATSLPVSQREQIIKNQQLAKQLGAEIITLNDNDIVKALMNFARERNISKIIMGKRIQSRWQRLFFRSLADEMWRYSEEIDIYFIHLHNKKDFLLQKKLAFKPRSKSIAYCNALLIISGATLVNLGIYPYLSLSNLIMVYLLAVIWVARRGNRGPAVMASILSVLSYDFFFIPPRLSFAVSDTQYLITLVVMLLVGQVISHLTILTRHQAEAARLQEQRTAALHTLSRQLASSRGINLLLQVAVRYIAEVFKCEVCALLPDAQGQLSLVATGTTQSFISDKDLSVAKWVYEHGQAAGLGTQTLTFANMLFLPLQGAKGTLGIICVRPLKTETLVLQEQWHLLEACINQVALALEADRWQEQAQKAQRDVENERMRNTLLSSVSHDLRTPLTAIMGSADSLLRLAKNNSAFFPLAENIYQQSKRLNRLLENLLQSMRLDTGQIQLHKTLHSIEEVLESAIKQLTALLTDRSLVVDISADLPLIPLDEILLEQVVINLLENAIYYTPENTSIHITAMVTADRLVVRVKDQGTGIALADLDKIFDKFYRGKTAQHKSGAGLGLAICQSIIQAHGGEIWVENHPHGGAVFSFSLPIKL